MGGGPNIQGVGKIPTFNKRVGQKKHVGFQETAVNDYKAMERTKTGRLIA